MKERTQTRIESSESNPRWFNVRSWDLISAWQNLKEDADPLLSGSFADTLITWHSLVSRTNLLGLLGSGATNTVGMPTYQGSLLSRCLGLLGQVQLLSPPSISLAWEAVFRFHWKPDSVYVSRSHAGGPGMWLMVRNTNPCVDADSYLDMEDRKS